MRFNAAGSAVTGFGTLGIDGAAVAALSGQACGNMTGPTWLTSTKVIYNSGGVGGGGPWILQTYDVNTTAIAQVGSGGSNLVYGGNSIWGAFLAGSGVRTSIGGLGPFPAATLGNVSPSGQIIIITDYQSGTGLQVFNAAGAQTLNLPTTTAWNAPSPGNIASRNNILTWRTGPGNWQCIGTSGASQTYQVRVNVVTWTVPLVTAAGDLLFLEYDDTAGQLCLRYARTGQGWVIATTGSAYNPDCVEVSSGVVRIGYCTNPSETPESLVVANLTLATNVMSTGTVVGGVIVYGAPTVNPRVTFQVTAASDGSSDTLGHPKFSEPFVDPQTGKVTARSWTEWIGKTSRGISDNAAAVAAIPSASAPPGFSVITSTGEPPISANTAVLNLEAGPGIDIQLIPPSQTIKISAVPGSVGLSGLPSTETGDSWPSILPGPPGVQGPQGLMGPPGRDADEADAWPMPPGLPVWCLPPIEAHLTNAQMLTLPTIPVDIAPPVGTTQRLIWIGTALALHLAGDFGNLEAVTFSYWEITLGGNAAFSSYLADDPGTGLTYVTQFLTGAVADHFVWFQPRFNTSSITEDWGLLSVVRGGFETGLGLQLSVSNGTAGNYSGGHANNVLRTFSFFAPAITLG